MENEQDVAACASLYSPEALESVRECPVCNELFNESQQRPKVLPCGHTLCKTCLARTTRLGNIQCPIDRHSYAVPADDVNRFPDNYALISLCDAKSNATYQPPAESSISSHNKGERLVSQTIRDILTKLKLTVGDTKDHVQKFTSVVNNLERDALNMKTEIRRDVDDIILALQRERTNAEKRVDHSLQCNVALVEQFQQKLSLKVSLVEHFVAGVFMDIDDPSKVWGDDEVVQIKEQAGTYGQNLSEIQQRQCITEPLPDINIDEILSCIQPSKTQTKLRDSGEHTVTTNATAVNKHSANPAQANPAQANQAQASGTRASVKEVEPSQSFQNQYGEKMQTKLTIGGYGSEPGQFRRPRGVTCMTSNDVILVADTDNHRVQTFDMNGVYLSYFGSKGSGSDQLHSPTDVISAQCGSIYVSDRLNKMVKVFSSNGEFQQTWACCMPRFRDKDFVPWGIALNRSLDHIFICDKENDNLHEFTVDGKPINTIGNHGQARGQFNGVMHVAMGSHGEVVTSDTGNHRVSVFGGDGELLRVWGEPGEDVGQFLEPTGVGVDNSGNVLVADRGQGGRIQIFSPDGTVIGAIATNVQFAGGLHVTRNGSVLLANVSNGCIKVFS